jgi:hypothetical protein
MLLRVAIAPVVVLRKFLTQCAEPVAGTKVASQSLLTDAVTPFSYVACRC